ncbi:MAG: hypothetical protein IKI11_00910 [Neisseriaceae bacterium]|nr:hypothetical protein [Neisseriaceae bacterium]
MGFQPTATPQGVDWQNNERLILPYRKNGGSKTHPTAVEIFVSGCLNDFFKKDF